MDKLKTQEDYLKNPGFRLLNKLMKSDFPWLYNLIPPLKRSIYQFPDVAFPRYAINPYMIQKETNWPIYDYVFSPIFREDDYLYSQGRLGSVFSAPFEETYAFEKPVEERLKFWSKELPKEITNGMTYLFDFDVAIPLAIPIPDNVIIKKT